MGKVVAGSARGTASESEHTRPWCWDFHLCQALGAEDVLRNLLRGNSDKLPD